MSKFMMIVGILAAATGVALGLMEVFPKSQAALMLYSITMETAVILLIGGLGLIGLGGAIAASEQSALATRELRNWLAGHEANLMPHHEPAASAPVDDAPFVPVMVAKTAVVVAAAEVVEAAVMPPPPAVERAPDIVKTTTAETIAALEKAKADISEALGEKFEPEPEPEPLPPPPPPALDDGHHDDLVAEEVVEEEEDSDLFVIEEKVIRGKPARVLSDGTVEAETDEGWMRFENLEHLEHLEEYLDAVAPAQPARKA